MRFLNLLMIYTFNSIPIRIKKAEIRFPGTNGDKYYNLFSIPIYSRSKELIGRTLNFQDITSERLLIEELHLMATTDALTGLCNRRKFLEICDYEIKKHKRKTNPLSIIMMDLDHFKKINDRYGHQAGDIVLQNTAQCFSRILRSGSTAARYGGEEFIILLPETDEDGALILADRCRMSIAAMEIPYENKTLTITASIGVATSFDFENDSIDTIISRADKALYMAKESGRNRVVVYTP